MEAETEDGNPISLTNEAMMKDDFYSYKNLENIMLSGITLKEPKKNTILLTTMFLVFTNGI